MITIDHPERLRPFVGQELSTSDWLLISQDRIDAFANATGDHQWIHVDRQRAAAETPFGATIAHGFLTLSLVSALMRNAISIGGLQMTINYGLNRVRFVSPVPSDTRIRGRIALIDLADRGDALQATWSITVERESAERPCLVAEWLVRYYSTPVAGQEGHAAER